MPHIGDPRSGPAGIEVGPALPLEGFFQRVMTEAELPVVWNEFRIWAYLGTSASMLTLGFIWNWPGGYLLALVAAVAVADAFLRRRLNRHSLSMTVALDLCLAGIGVTVADLDPAALGAPYAYMMAAPLLLLPLRRALPMMAISTAWGVFALTVSSPFPLPTWVPHRTVDVVSYTLFTAMLLGLVAVLGVSLTRSREFTARKLRAEAALAEAGGGLLANVDESSLLEAIEAIREATGAATAFVAENSGDRSSGPAAAVRQVVEDGSLIDWTLPYMQYREAASELAKGRPVRLDDPIAIILGLEPRSAVAVAVPISVTGEWSGFLGIAYTDLPAPHPDLRVLETFAAMIGAFLERRHAYRRLEQAVQSKDQFLASVSHEIKNPLTSVLGLAAVLGDDDGGLSGSDQRDLISMIRRESQDVADLVEDLLVAGRLEIDQVKVSSEPVCLADEISRVLETRLDRDEADVFVASTPSHVAMADPARVRQILRNLLTNALRYGGPEVTITTHRDGEEVTLVFSDNGDGIPPEQRKRIFDPYHRTEKGVTRPDSVGLGLAVARQLARLMDGDLTLRTDLGPATFQLSLPSAPRETGGETHPPDVILVGED